DELLDRVRAWMLVRDRLDVSLRRGGGVQGGRPPAPNAPAPAPGGARAAGGGGGGGGHRAGRADTGGGGVGAGVERRPPRAAAPTMPRRCSGSSTRPACWSA